MRKTLLSIGTAMAVMSMNAQVPYSIPNAGFETWITTGSQAGKAQDWSGYGDIGLLVGVPSYTMLTTYYKDGSVKKSGSYSMRIQNRSVGSNNLPGIAWLGTAGTNTANIGLYGIPFTQSITASGVWAQYTINAPATSNKDTAVIFFQTTKWTGTTEILVQDASILITSNTTGFQNFTKSAYTATNVTCDTLWIIAFSSFNDADQNIDNLSQLWIDDLTLTVATGITAPVLNFVDTRFAPNPASDEVRFTTSALNIGGALKLYDALGKEVLTVPVTSALDNRFSVEALPAGIYFYQIHSASGEINAQGKLVVTK
jgi:hypothetical protein